MGLEWNMWLEFNCGYGEWVGMWQRTVIAIYIVLLNIPSKEENK